MIRPPVMMRCQNGFTFRRLAPLLMVVSRIAPRSGPGTLPTAPNRLAPPITDEAIDCSSQPSPVVATPMPMREAVSTPARAASPAETM